MTKRSMADAVRAVLVKRAFVPGDPGAGGMPPGGDPSMMGGMPPGGDPSMMGGMPPGGMPPGGDPSMMGGMPPGMDPSMMGGMPPGGDPMAGMPPMGVDPSMMGGAPQTGMINMTADEFTKFIKQMMAAFGANGAPVQAQQQAQPQADIGAKLDTLIAVLQGKASQPLASPALIAGA